MSKVEMKVEVEVLQMNVDAGEHGKEASPLHHHEAH